MVSKKLSLKLGWFYPDLMNTYGDYGNVVVLQNRAAWVGVKLEVVKVDIHNNQIGDRDIDLIFMGGAQDRQQSIVSSDLINNKRPLINELLDRQVPGLFICGAYQLMGNYYVTAEGTKIEGLKIFDLYTEQPAANSQRLIGNITLQSTLFPQTSIVGFENHGGRTYLGSQSQPLGTVIVGHGNNGEDKKEGVVYKNAIGSYLHGPILPINPIITDWLISKAIETKYTEKLPLAFPGDDFEKMIRESISG
jgi:CobQ-like glutamine amidotransferase family enzyme